MKRRSDLKVQPIRRYKKPSYPSYEDKNPIEHPETMPYPFSHKAINALLAAGVLVGGAFMSCGEVSGKVNEVDSPIVTQDSLYNPFTMNHLGLPFMPAMFGTGLPSRLNHKEARGVIDKVFREEGIKMEKDFLYKKNNVEVLLNGYDENSKIGYVWIGYNKFGIGMVRNYHGSLPYLLYDSWSPLSIIASSNFEQLEAFFKNTFKNIKEEDLKSFSERKAQIELLENKQEKRSAYELLFLDTEIYFIQNSKRKFSKKYLAAHLKNEDLEHKEKVLTQLEFVIAIDEFIEELKANKEGDKKNNKSVINLAQQISKTDNVKVQIEEFDILVTTFQMTFRNNNFFEKKKIKKSKIEKLLRIKDKDDFIEAAKKMIYKSDGDKLAISELYEIEKIADSKKDFIIPLSSRDNRFMYEYFGLTEEEDKELKAIQENGTDEEYMEKWGALKEISTERGQREVLQKLETQVRQYIHWAKQQQGY